MKADLTRDSFDPLKGFSAVLMQQGRVQLDADWNEQASIVRYMLRRLAAEVFPNGGGSGFGLTALRGVSDDFAIDAGTYYAGGVMCELHSTMVPVVRWDVDNHKITVAAWTVDGVAYQGGQYVELSDQSPQSALQPLVTKIAGVDYASSTLTLEPTIDITRYKGARAGRVRRIVTYRTQPIPPDAAALATGQVYLDAWEEVVTSLQDGSILEVALNGPDTAARVRVGWRVRTTPYVPPTQLSSSSSGSSSSSSSSSSFGSAGTIACMTGQALESTIRPGVPLLRAWTQPAPPSADPCTISPDARYRGPENQLYRVEIHGVANPAQVPSFKWSREDGSVAFPVVNLESDSGAAAVTIATLGDLGRDDRFGLAQGDFVEIEHDRSAFAAVPAPLLEVLSIDRENLAVKLGGNAPAIEPALHPVLRRWDHKRGNRDDGGLVIGPDGAATIEENQWQNLEDGVQVKFTNIADARTGDYWLIPARVATRDVIWPKESITDANGKTFVNPIARPPHGDVHYYAPLAVVNVNVDHILSVTRCSEPKDVGEVT